MTLPYVLPTFNLTCDVWHDGTPTTDPPDLSPTCQLYLNTRGLLDIQQDAIDRWDPPVWLRVPMGTDLQVLDTVEVPQGSGWLYRVRWVDRVHLGFANEYWVGVCDQVSNPQGGGSGGGGGGGGGGSMLLEGGDYVLLEGGDQILLE